MTINDYFDDLYNCRDTLMFLSAAFSRTGNHQVGNELSELSERITEASRGIMDHRIKESQENLASVRNIAGGLLGVVLNGNLSQSPKG